MTSKEKKQKKLPESSIKDDFIRRFKARPVIFIGTIVILVIVVVAFVFVPALVPEARGQEDLTFGTYDKIPITFVPGNYFSKVRENIASRYTVDDSNYFTLGYQIWREAFEQTVAHTAILLEMKRAGYTPAAERVDRAVVQRPEFQENGRFSQARYNRISSSARLSLWREERDTIIEGRYRTDINGLRVSSRETAFAGTMAGPERSFDMAAFPLSAYPDSELVLYVQNNPDLFRVVHFSMITIKSSEREARQILTSIQNGTTTFEDAARTQSQDNYADSGGDLGVKLAYEMAREIPDAQERETVLSLQRGDFSGIVKVPDGWGFFRCEETPYPADPGDDDTLKKIRSYYMENERGRVEDWLIVRADELVADAKELGFDTAVAGRGLVKRSFGPLPLNYGGNAFFSGGYNYNLFTPLSSFSVEELNGADTSEIFWRTAFATPLNTPSDPVVVNSYIMVFYPREEIIPDSEKIQSVKNFYTSWLSYFTDIHLRSFFANTDKLDDKFINVFFRQLWSPGNE
ncbi:MAG: peptidylprolyl isomerase [Treponema sp.]|nr:peptidylprolyl isomerase [Treponema sp.]